MLIESYIVSFFFRLWLSFVYFLTLTFTHSWLQIQNNAFSDKMSSMTMIFVKKIELFANILSGALAQLQGWGHGKVERYPHPKN